MLSLAMSMILYGVLVKNRDAGLDRRLWHRAADLSRLCPAGAMHHLALFWAVLGFGALAALLCPSTFRSIAGALAVPVRATTKSAWNFSACRSTGSFIST